jgi:DNA polymerase
MAAFLYQKPESEIGKKSHERQVGKGVILGAGFVMGKDRLYETCRGMNIAITLEESELAIKAYRAKYPEVKRMWYALYEAACSAVQLPGKVFSTNKVEFRVAQDRNGVPWLMVKLASQRALYYRKPYLVPGKYSPTINYKGSHPKTGMWCDLSISISKLIENIVQATARDIMAQGLLNIQERLPEVDLICTVHDEGIGEADDNDQLPELASKFEFELCNMPPWADGLPLRAEGYEAYRYRKD